MSHGSDTGAGLDPQPELMLSRVWVELSVCRTV